MSLRKSVSVILAITLSGTLISQSYLSDPKYGSDEESRKQCVSDLSTMHEFSKINMYDQAFDSWQRTFNNCPEASKNIYIDGAKIVKHKIENSSDAEQKNQFIEMLMKVYDSRIEYFGQKGFVRGMQGMDLLRYDNESTNQAYKYLGEAVDLLKDDTRESILVTYLQSSYLLFKKDEKPATEFIQDYFKAASIIEKQYKEKPDRRTEEAMETMEKMFIESGAGDCETVIGMFQPKFNANPNDPELLKKITGTLSELDCEDSELFAHSAENLFEIEASSDAAVSLAKLFYVRKDYQKSAEYYKKAIGMEQDAMKKSQYLYELAGLTLGYLNDPKESRTYALQAIELRPNWGDPYILIGNAYASSSASCGNDAFERAAVYLAAVDKFAKAKAVDPSVTETVNSMIGKYSKHFPNNEEAFFLGYTDGQSYTVGCWINETTTIRTVKQ